MSNEILENKITISVVEDDVLKEKEEKEKHIMEKGMYVSKKEKKIENNKDKFMKKLEQKSMNPIEVDGEIKTTVLGKPFLSFKKIGKEEYKIMGLGEFAFISGEFKLPVYNLNEEELSRNLTNLLILRAELKFGNIRYDNFDTYFAIDNQLARFALKIGFSQGEEEQFYQELTLTYNLSDTRMKEYTIRRYEETNIYFLEGKKILSMMPLQSVKRKIKRDVKKRTEL